MPQTVNLMLLDEIDELLHDSSCWTRDFLARNFSGHPRVASDPEAVSFCLTGAISRVCRDNHRQEHRIVLEQLFRMAVYPFDIDKYNDLPSRTFADIKATIAKVRADIQREVDKPANIVLLREPTCLL